ncbi:hypothetical protein C5T93_08895 [Raoultella ornithinolytica]|nr:hypothetical protein C5T93_08895 [Raoultella ornithinolytica]
MAALAHPGHVPLVRSRDSLPCRLDATRIFLCKLRPYPPGRSIRLHFTKLLTILKQQTENDFVLCC